MGVNGSTMVPRYTEGAVRLDAATVLAKHLEQGGFALPVNMMICNATGEAARVLIGRGPPQLTVRRISR